MRWHLTRPVRRCIHRLDHATYRRTRRREPPLDAIFSNHPSVAPHVHSLIVIHPRLTDRFLAIVDMLEATWRRIPVQARDARSSPLFSGPSARAMYVNRTLHADVPFALRIRELMTQDLAGNRGLIRAKIRNVVDYSAKLGRRGSADGVDLFTVLPRTSDHVHSGARPRSLLNDHEPPRVKGSPLNLALLLLEAREIANVHARSRTIRAIPEKDPSRG